MADTIRVETPTAVYLTQAPGMRVYIGGGVLGTDDPNVHHGFIQFFPTGRVEAHPHALHQTYQVEGYALVSDPSLIKMMDKASEMGNVPFLRHPSPNLVISNDVGVSVAAGSVDNG